MGNDDREKDLVKYRVPAIVTTKSESWEKAEEIDKMLRDVLAGKEEGPTTLDMIKRDFPSQYNDFLLVFADITNSLKDLTLTKNSYNEGELGLVLRSVGTEFYSMMLKNDGAFEKTSPDDKVQLFSDLVAASINLRKYFNQTDVTHITFFANEVDRDDFFLEKKNRPWLDKAMNAYPEAAKQGGKSLLGFFPTLTIFLEKAEDEGKLNSDGDRIIKGLIEYGMSASKFDKNPASEAYWTLRIMAGDENLEGSYKAKDRIGKFVNGLLASGEKEALRLFDDLNYRGLPADDKTLDNFLKLHEKTGILNFSRLWKTGDTRLLDELVKNLESKEYNSEKPVLIIVLPRGGAANLENLMSRGSAMDAFKNEQDKIFDLTRQFKVFVYEAGSVPMLEQIRKDVENREGDLARRGFVVYMAGHGSEKSVNFNSSMFGESHVEKKTQGFILEGKKQDTVIGSQKSIVSNSEFYPKNESEKRFDLDEKEDRYHLAVLVKGAMLVLFESCLTGKDKENVANFVAKVSSGTIAVAPTKEITEMRLTLPGKYNYSVEEMKDYVKYFDRGIPVDPLISQMGQKTPTRSMWVH